MQVLTVFRAVISFIYDHLTMHTPAFINIPLFYQTPIPNPPLDPSQSRPPPTAITMPANHQSTPAPPRQDPAFANPEQLYRGATPPPPPPYRPIYNQVDDLKELLTSTLEDFVRDALADSLSDSLGTVMTESFEDAMDGRMADLFHDWMREDLHTVMKNKLENFVKDAFTKSIRDSLEETVQAGCNRAMQAELPGVLTRCLQEKLEASVAAATEEELREQENNEIRQELASARGQIARCNEMFESYRNELARCQGRLAERERVLAAREHDLRVCQRELVNCENRFVNATSEAGALGPRCEALELELGRRDVALGQLREMNLRQQETIARIILENFKLKDENTEMTVHLADSQGWTEVGAATKQVKMLKARNKVLQEELESSLKSLQFARDDRERMRLEKDAALLARG